MFDKQLIFEHTRTTCPPLADPWRTPCPKTGPQTLKCIAQIALLPADGIEVAEEDAHAMREITAKFMAEDKKRLNWYSVVSRLTLATAAY